MYVLEVRGSGREPDRDHSGILVSAADITVEDNVLRDVLFGVRLHARTTPAADSPGAESVGLSTSSSRRLARVIAT